ncbi:hypothetical protein ACJJU9_07360 [Pseudomonas helleri]|uniref:hypothetical protein n=1 Tax=Pseudomonas helleri TaxID=1608996 RepID=UPI00389A6F79
MEQLIFSCEHDHHRFAKSRGLPGFPAVALRAFEDADVQRVLCADLALAVDCPQVTAEVRVVDEEIGLAMLEIARHGAPKNILETVDIRGLVKG